MAAEQMPEGLIKSELNQPSRDPLSDTSIILARGMELLHREDNPSEAAIVLQQALNVAKQRGLRNPCVFLGTTWKAEALRIVAERAPEGRARVAALKQARRAVRTSLFTTRWYLTSRPHALRESAILSTLEGNASKARRYFEASLKLARQQAAAFEVAQTELAMGEAGLRFAWPNAAQQVESATREIARIRGFAKRDTLPPSAKGDDR